MKGLYRVALMLGLTAFAATSLEAAEIDHPTDEITDGVRIVNNHVGLVRVYVVDAQGRLHRLGRVARGELKEFQIPEGIAQESFRIKVFPNRQPAGSPQQDDYAVKTNLIDLNTDSQVTVWVEPDLRRSVVELARG